MKPYKAELEKFHPGEKWSLGVACGIFLQVCAAHDQPFSSFSPLYQTDLSVTAEILEISDASTFELPCAAARLARAEVITLRFWSQALGSSTYPITCQFLQYQIFQDPT